jgi:hypothetical protein
VFSLFSLVHSYFFLKNLERKITKFKTNNNGERKTDNRIYLTLMIMRNGSNYVGTLLNGDLNNDC